MSRRAFVVIAKWPFNQLTRIGKVTDCFTGGTENHIGILIPCSSSEEIQLHTDGAISNTSAFNQEHVTFDYMIDGYPRFQSTTDPNYWTKEAQVWCYPILGVDAADVHAACVEAAKIRPYNHGCYRINGMCGGCWPCHTWPSNTPEMAQSTCVAMTMRIIARAKAKSKQPFVSDRATLTVLGIPSCGPSNPCGGGALTGFRPRGALEAMQRSGILGRPLEGFELAISQCRGGPQNNALGFRLPDLSRIER